jgi:hypothetical protein
MQKCLAISLLALASTFSLSGQTATSHKDLPALKFNHQVKQTSSSWFVDYVQYAGEPAFRIRVHHYHKWCNGYLFVTPTRVAYVPQFTPAVNDGVMISRGDIAGVTPRYSGYNISIANKTYAFAFLSDPDMYFAEGKSDGRTELLNFVGLALSDFGAAQRQFLMLLAGSGAEANGAPRLTAAPIVKILNPSDAINLATVDASAPAQRVLGIAAASGGIKAVTVNGVPAALLPLSPQIVQFTSSNLLLKNLGANPVSVVATSGDDSATQVVFSLIQPGVRITEPELDGKNSDPTVTIRGLIVGMRNLQRVDLGGKNLAVTKQLDGTFAFAAVNVPVSIGANYIPGFVVRPDGERELFWATVWRVPPGPPPLSFERIEGALKADVTNGRLASLIEQYGVDFELTPQAERYLRSIGANKTLIDAIANAQ